MNLKDRGNKKWTSLMLVEHKKRLKELKEKENHLKKPELDDQIKEEINSKINQALNNNFKLKLTYFNDSSFVECKGKITGIDSIEKCIKIVDKNNLEKKINLENVIELDLL
jgi:5-methylcytosine-specific restriction endonuclease McrBC GTP-binding regulatory subunit McrB